MDGRLTATLKVKGREYPTPVLGITLDKAQAWDELKIKFYWKDFYAPLSTFDGTEVLEYPNYTFKRASKWLDDWAPADDYIVTLIFDGPREWKDA